MLFIFLLIGIILGIFIGLISLNLKCNIGTLNIDYSDEQPLLFLELNEGESPHTVAKKKAVIMNVKHKNYISRD